MTADCLIYLVPVVLPGGLTRPQGVTPIPSCARSPSAFSELINRFSSSNGRNLISSLKMDEMPQHEAVIIWTFSSSFLGEQRPLGLPPSNRIIVLSDPFGRIEAIMRSSFLVFSMRILIIALTRLLITNADWVFSNDDLLFPDQIAEAPVSASLFDFAEEPVEFSSLDDMALSSSSSFEPLFFEDMGDTSDVLFSTNDVFADNTFELADCSASEIFPTIGKNKARVRRIDEPSEACKNPTTDTDTDTPLPGADSNGESLDPDDLRNLLTHPDTHRMLDELESSTEGYHTACYLFTRGRLPWGVCSSGNPFDKEPFSSEILVPAWGRVERWLLRRVTIGTLRLIFCLRLLGRKLMK